MAKIARKTQKIFGNNNPTKIGQFGSAQLGAPTVSTDLDVIQALAAYEEGWNDAVISGERRPALEEFNGLKFLTDSQIAYLFQEGIPEYDNGTLYFINSIVKESGTTKVYKSLIDDNIAQVLTNPTKWELLGDLKLATKEVIINKLSDFPPDDGTKIILETGISYIINQSIVSSFYFEIPVGGSVNIQASSITNALVYTGSGGMFRGVNIGLFSTQLTLFQAPAGEFFDFEGLGSCILISSFFQNAQGCGSIRIDNFTAFFSQFTDIDTGFIFSDKDDLSLRSSVSISHCVFFGWKNITTTNMILISGNIDVVAIQDSRLTLDTNIIALDFAPSLATANGGKGTNIATQAFFDTTLGGDVYSSTSLKQDYLNATVFGSVGIPDSTVTIKIFFEINALTTTINTVNVPEAINARWNLKLPERMVFQDKFIADFTTDIITSVLNDGTTPFNHNLVNGDNVTLITLGTLPAGLDDTISYFIINSTATTFQLSLTDGGGVVDFTDNGSGTLYYRHVTGINALSWIIYIGNEEEKIIINAHVSLQVTGSGTKDAGSVLIKTDTSFIETVSVRGSIVNITNIKPQSSGLNDLTILKQGEGLMFAIENRSDADDLDVIDATAVLNRG